ETARHVRHRPRPPDLKATLQKRLLCALPGRAIHPARRASRFGNSLPPKLELSRVHCVLAWSELLTPCTTPSVRVLPPGHLGEVWFPRKSGMHDPLRDPIAGGRHRNGVLQEQLQQNSVPNTEPCPQP